MHSSRRGAVTAPDAEFALDPVSPRRNVVSTPLRRASDFSSIPIGEVPRPGKAHVRDAVWSMDALGLEKDKGFHFACRSLKGDGFLVARVTAVGGPAARAGILMRSGTGVSTDTKAVWLQLADDGELRALWRQGLGASRVETHGNPAGVPCWLKLARRGNAIHGWGSVNGRDWDLVATVHFQQLPDTMLVGLAASSGSTTDAVTSTFDEVRLGTMPAGPAPSPPWLAVAGSPGRVHLAWRRSAGAICYNVLRSARAGGPYVRIAYGIVGLDFDDTSPTRGIPHHYVIEAVRHGQPALRSNEVPGTAT